MRKVVIFKSFGHFGDYLILREIVRQIITCNPDCQFFVDLKFAFSNSSFLFDNQAFDDMPLIKVFDEPITYDINVDLVNIRDLLQCRPYNIVKLNSLIQNKLSEYSLKYEPLDIKLLIPKFIYKDISKYYSFLNENNYTQKKKIYFSNHLALSGQYSLNSEAILLSIANFFPDYLFIVPEDIENKPHNVVSMADFGYKQSNTIFNVPSKTFNNSVYEMALICHDCDLCFLKMNGRDSVLFCSEFVNEVNLCGTSKYYMFDVSNNEYTTLLNKLVKDAGYTTNFFNFLPYESFTCDIISNIIKNNIHL